MSHILMLVWSTYSRNFRWRAMHLKSNMLLIRPHLVITIMILLQFGLRLSGRSSQGMWIGTLRPVHTLRLRKCSTTKKDQSHVGNTWFDGRTTGTTGSQDQICTLKGSEITRWTLARTSTHGLTFVHNVTYHAHLKGEFTSIPPRRTVWMWRNLKFLKEDLRMKM